MTKKQNSLDFNTKLEITHLTEVGGLLKSEVGRWYELTSSTLFIALKTENTVSL
jgi:hypothetical protein